MWTCLLAQEPTPYIRRARADPPGSVCQDAVRQSLKRGVLCCLNGGVADVTVLLGCCCYDTRAVIDWNCCRIWIIGFLTLFQWSQPRPCADEAQQSRKTEIGADGWSEQNEKLHIICNRLDRWTSAKKERKIQLWEIQYLAPSTTLGCRSSQLIFQCCVQVPFYPCVIHRVHALQSVRTLLNVEA